MATQEALAQHTNASEWYPNPTLAAAPDGVQISGDESATESSQPIPANAYESFFRESTEYFSQLGIFTVRREIARVRAMTGDFIGVDYAEGVFRSVALGSLPVREEEQTKTAELIDNQRAERLRWIAAVASVAQTASTKDIPPDPNKPEKVTEYRRMKEHDAPLKGIASKALSLHFELRAKQTDQEVISEIEEHLVELIEIESAIYQGRESLSRVIAVKNDDEKAEAKERFGNSLHRKQKLQAFLFEVARGRNPVIAT